MNLTDVKLLFRFNAWANRIVFDALTPVPEAQYLEDLKSSHGGIHGTLKHLVGAEQVWLLRWQGTFDPKLVSATEARSLAELKSIWEEADGERGAFVSSWTEAKLLEKLSVTALSGAVYDQSHWQMSQHVVNHSSYHRGQIVTMMRQLGVKPPATDLIKFYREQD